jgi:hypothetical protein
MAAFSLRMYRANSAARYASIWRELEQEACPVLIWGLRPHHNEVYGHTTHRSLGAARKKILYEGKIYLGARANPVIFQHFSTAHDLPKHATHRRLNQNTAGP